MDDGALKTSSLQKAEKRLRLFQMAERVAHIGHWRWDIATSEVVWSEEVYRIHGVDPETFEVTLDSALQAYHPDDRKTVQTSLAQALEDKAPFDFELRIVRPTGEVRQVYSIGECECDVDGTVIAMFGVFQDVTERHREQEAKARFISAFDASDEVLAIFDASDLLVFCNQKFRELNKDVANSTELGTRFEDHVRARLDAGRYKDAAGREEAWLNDRMALHRRGFGSYELQRDDGQWLLISEQKLGDGSTLLRATNITELKRTQQALEYSENKFRDFANASSDWFWEMDETLRFVRFSEQQPDNPNPASGRYLGFGRQQVAREDTTTEKWQRHFDDLENRRPFEDFRYLVEGRDGVVYTLSVSGVPFFDEAGVFQGYRGTGKDVSDQVHAAQALHRSVRDAQRAAEVKSRFLATMSHEFRTPLNAILGFSEMILRQELGSRAADTYRNYAEHIHTSGERMLALVNDILDLSTIEAGKRELKIEPVALESVFRACEIELSALGHNRAPVKTSVQTEPPVLHTDRQALHQIVLNLLGNALKFTPASGQINLSAKSTGDGDVMIVVEDTGRGMPSDMVNHIGEPFLRGQNNPHTSFDGTGLGLSIVKNLVDTLDGTLHVSSEPGVGTSVAVVIPDRTNANG